MLKKVFLLGAFSWLFVAGFLVVGGSPVFAVHEDDRLLCIEETSSSSGEEFDACMEARAANDPTPPAPVVGGGLQPNEVSVEDNPIYERLNEIVGFLARGVGLVVTISMVYAGFQYIFSRGDPGKTQAAVNRMIQAGIALFLYIFATAILNWLIPGGIFN